MWVAEDCDSDSGQQFTEAGERWHAEVANGAKERELVAWEQVGDFSSLKAGALAEEVADSRWVITWKEAAGCEGFSGPRYWGWQCGHRGLC